MATQFQVTFDCADPGALSRFWADALHYRLDDPPEGFDSWPSFLQAQGVPESEWNSASGCSDPDKAGPRLYFQRVPEPKSVKNRVHLDLNAGGGHAVALEERTRRVDAEVERLRGLGASVIEPRSNAFGEYWVVMADPEGNELCVQ